MQSDPACPDPASVDPGRVEPAGDAFVTLPHGRTHQHSVEIERSVFLTHLQRVGSEDEARAVIAERRRAHADAGHHCTAFILGADRDLRRSSDDGEPAGTAGIPMLQVLAQRLHGDHPFSDLVAVVSRWFGGTKLGAGGLVRAYGSSVGSALDGAPLVLNTAERRFAIDLPMATAGRDESVLRSAALTVVDQSATAQAVRLTLSAADDDPDGAGLAARCAALLGRPVGLAALGVVRVDRPLS